MGSQGNGLFFSWAQGQVSSKVPLLTKMAKMDTDAVTFAGIAFLTEDVSFCSWDKRCEFHYEDAHFQTTRTPWMGTKRGELDGATADEDGEDG